MKNNLGLWLSTSKVSVYTMLLVLIASVLFTGKILNNNLTIEATGQKVTIAYSDLQYLKITSTQFTAEKVFRDNFTICTWVLSGKTNDIVRNSDSIVFNNCSITERNRMVWTK